MKADGQGPNQGRGEGQDAKAQTLSSISQSPKANGHDGAHSAPNGHHFNGDSNGNGTNGHSNGHAPSPQEATSNGAGGVVAEISAKLLERAGVVLGEASESAQNEQFAGFQTDAPSCDSCGAITVRNGNCYLCHNCGASMGCS